MRQKPLLNPAQPGPDAALPVRSRVLVVDDTEDNLFLAGALERSIGQQRPRTEINLALDALERPLNKLMGDIEIRLLLSA